LTGINSGLQRPGETPAMNTPLAFEADCLRHYARPGPRYTSYPTAPQFAGWNRSLAGQAALGIPAQPHQTTRLGRLPVAHGLETQRRRLHPCRRDPVLDVPAAAQLAADDLVRVDRGMLRTNARGRLLLRSVATCFDRYLQLEVLCDPKAIRTPRCCGAAGHDRRRR